jgi:uncharacterized membrane protein (DUF485 family)
LPAVDGSTQQCKLERSNELLRQRRAEFLCHLLADFAEKAETTSSEEGGHDLLKVFTDFAWNYQPSLLLTGDDRELPSSSKDVTGTHSTEGSRNESKETGLSSNGEGRSRWRKSVERIGSMKRLSFVPEASEGTAMQRVFLMFEDSSKSFMGKVILTIIVLTIFVSTVTYVMESIPEFRYTPKECDRRRDLNLKPTVTACEPKPAEYFLPIEAVCILIFTVDYAVRVLTVHAGSETVYKGLVCTWEYFKRPVNLVDLVAILPFYLQLGFGGDSDFIKGFRVLRLVRVLRIFKLARLHPGVQMFWEVIVISGQPLLILIFLDTIIVLVFAALIYTVEGSTYSVDNTLIEAGHPTGAYAREDWNLGGLEPTPFRSIPFSIWWVCVTTTTVGYGDYAPKTALGQFIGVTCFYIGIIFLALPISVLGSNFGIIFRRYQKERKESKETPPRRRRQSIQYSSFGATPFIPVGRGLRQKIFFLFEAPSASKLGKCISILVLVTIFVVTCSFVMESMPDFKETPERCYDGPPTVEDCEPKPMPIFEITEVLGISIFTVDYICRMATVHAVSIEEALDSFVDTGVPYTPLQLTIKYAIQWLNIIDFLAIAPFYFKLALGDFGISSFSSVLRVLRLIRVFRVLKMPQLSTCVTMFVSIVRDSLPAIFLLFFLTLVTSVLITSCMFFAEGSNFSVDRFPDQYPQGVYIRETYDGRGWEPTPFKSIPSAFWWFFTTATTVGYGDYYPTTGFGRVVGVLTFYMGIVLLALPITIIGGQFDRHYNQWLREIEELKSMVIVIPPAPIGDAIVMKLPQSPGSPPQLSPASSGVGHPKADFGMNEDLEAMRGAEEAAAAVAAVAARVSEIDSKPPGEQPAAAAASDQQPLRKTAAEQDASSPFTVRPAWS